MVPRSTRDWRGIKHHLGDYSTDDLVNLIDNAERTVEQIAEFAARVAAELARRDRFDTPSAA